VRTRPGADEGGGPHDDALGVAPAPRGARILVVDDSESIRGYLASLLGMHGHRVDTAEDGRRALGLIEAGASPDLVLLDVMMPGIDGIETLRRIRERAPRLPVVMVSVVGNARTIVEAMRAGASDYVSKPFVESELARVVARALARVEQDGERAQAKSGASEALWQGPALAQVRALIERVAETDVTVLIQGESGTGKEVVARALHAASRRRRGPFVKVNCAALPGELLESELFGYERGAFTGAVARKPGKFEVAQGGTLFLDEIAEMSPVAQAKLLHVLQDATFTRLGGNREIHVDVRVVAATHRVLAELAVKKLFREDLFFRLNVVNVLVPPLRERRDELPALLDHFLESFSARYGRVAHAPSARLRALLERHPFPGNVRELENLVKRIVVLGSEEPIVRELVARERATKRRARRFESLLRDVEARAGELPLREVGRRAALEAEREAIEQALLLTNWNRKHAARVLGVSYKTLLQKIHECELVPESA
jgi:two-component system response regulator AtoC